MPQPVPTAAELREMFVWTIRKWGKQMTPEELADALITCPTCADIIAAAHRGGKFPRRRSKPNIPI